MDFKDSSQPVQVNIQLIARSQEKNKNCISFVEALKMKLLSLISCWTVWASIRGDQVHLHMLCDYSRTVMSNPNNHFDLSTCHGYL